MARQKKFRQLDPNPPDFMKGDAGQGTEAISHDEAQWWGENGELLGTEEGRKLDEALARGGYELRPILDSILLAM